MTGSTCRSTPCTPVCRCLRKLDVSPAFLNQLTPLFLSFAALISLPLHGLLNLLEICHPGSGGNTRVDKHQQNGKEIPHDTVSFLVLEIRLRPDSQSFLVCWKIKDHSAIPSIFETNFDSTVLYNCTEKKSEDPPLQAKKVLRCGSVASPRNLCF